MNKFAKMKVAGEELSKVHRSNEAAKPAQPTWPQFTWPGAACRTGKRLQATECDDQSGLDWTRAKKKALWFILLWLCLPFVKAQTNEELFREYQFNFSTPGARAIALGGAFIGLADDSSSSFSNPAGLAFLRETAFTAEFRAQDTDPVLIEGNREFINFGFLEEGQSLENLSFTSLNYRIRKVYFGFYHYTYLNERQRREYSSRSFIGNVAAIDIQDVDLHLKGDIYGIGAAARFGKWKLGMTLNHMSYRGRTQYSVTHQQTAPTIEVSRFSSSIDDEDQDWGWSIGALFEPTDRLSLGLVWRNHPTFELDEQITETFRGQEVYNDRIQVPFVVPDIGGAGLRYRAGEGVSLLADWQWIRYSQIIKDGFVIVEALDHEVKEHYDTDDVVEIHLGAEWLIPLNKSVLAFRGGYFRNPIHAVTYKGDDLILQERFAGAGFSDENHYTAGIGWVFRNRLELDFAADIWERGREYTLSLIWRQK